MRYCVSFALLAGLAAAASATDNYIFGASGQPVSLTVLLSNSTLFTTDTSLSPISGGFLNQGFWSATAANIDANTNVVAGHFTASDYNDFYSFDISGLDLSGATILGMSLNVYTYDIEGSGTYRLSDVSTDPTTLNTNNGTSAAIFNDLGSGVAYGSFAFSEADAFENLSISLSQGAINDLTAARVGNHSYFSIGGSATTQAVPEPASMAALSLGGLALVRRRRAAK